MAASITEEIAIPEQSPMQRLGLAAERVAALRQELKGWKAEYDQALEAVLAAEPKFESSKFLKAVGKNGLMYREGSVGIVRTTRTVRKLDQGEFSDRYQKEFLQYANISLEDAEKVVGKDRISEMCDLDTSYVYKVVDLGGPV